MLLAPDGAAVCRRGNERRVGRRHYNNRLIGETHPSTVQVERY